EGFEFARTAVRSPGNCIVRRRPTERRDGCLGACARARHCLQSAGGGPALTARRAKPAMLHPLGTSTGTAMSRLPALLLAFSLLPLGADAFEQGREIASADEFAVLVPRARIEPENRIL